MGCRLGGEWSQQRRQRWQNSAPVWLVFHQPLKEQAVCIFYSLGPVVSGNDGLKHLCNNYGCLMSVFYVPGMFFISHKVDYPYFIDAEMKA